MYSSGLCSRLPSHSIHKDPTASLASRPFLNPNCVSPKNFSALASTRPVITLSIVLDACEIRLSVRKSSQSAAFSLFRIGTTTDLVKSFGHSPSSYMSLHISFNNCLASSPSNIATWNVRTMNEDERRLCLK